MTLAAPSAGPGLLWDVAGALLVPAYQIWLLWAGTDRCELSMLAGICVSAISWPCAPAWKLGKALKDSLAKVEPTMLSQPCSWPLDLCEGCFILTLVTWCCLSLLPQGSKKLLKRALRLLVRTGCCERQREPNVHLGGFLFSESHIKKANTSINSSRRKLLNPVLVILALRFASTGKKGRKERKHMVKY